jgi:probable HAF family extracellular repeat protein
MALALLELLSSIGMGQHAFRLKPVDTEELSNVGRLVEEADGQLQGLSIAGERGRDYELSHIVEPVIMYFDFESRNLEIESLRSDPPTNGSGASVPEDASGRALNISRDSKTAIGYIDNGFFTPYHAFRWTESTGLVDLGTLDPPNNVTKSSYAHDVSSDGSVIVGFSSTPGLWEHAFRWTAATGMVDLGSGAAPGLDGSSRAYGTSADGNVVVGWSSFPTTTAAFRWTEIGGFQQLGPNAVAATAVNAEGTVVIGTRTTGINAGGAFRWTETGGLQDLGALPGHTRAIATGISDDGSIVVGVSSSDYIALTGVGGTLTYNESASRAFYWTAATGMQDLTQLLDDAGVDMTGVTIAAATGISPSGAWIGGSALTPDTAPGETTPILVSLTETLPLPGDFNDDGQVDAADYVVWRKGLGSDFSPDHYGVWKANFGKTATGTSSHSSVPEPATSLMMIAAVASLLSVRRCWDVACDLRRGVALWPSEMHGKK